MTEVQDTMALNTPVTLTVVTITPQREYSMQFPGHQLSVLYNQIMQLMQIHFPEDDEYNQHGTERCQMEYIGLTHLRNNLLAPNRPLLRFLTTHGVDRDVETRYYIQVDLQEEEDDDEDDDTSEIISIASSVSLHGHLREEEEEDIHTPSPIHR